MPKPGDRNRQRDREEEKKAKRKYCYCYGYKSSSINEYSFSFSIVTILWTTSNRNVKNKSSWNIVKQSNHKKKTPNMNKKLYLNFVSFFSLCVYICSRRGNNLFVFRIVCRYMKWNKNESEKKRRISQQMYRERKVVLIASETATAINLQCGFELKTIDWLYGMNGITVI